MDLHTALTMAIEALAQEKQDRYYSWMNNCRGKEPDLSHYDEALEVLKILIQNSEIC